MASQTLTIRRPDDWHVHLRDGEMLRAVAPYTARQFARAIVMPNLVPPVTTRRGGGRLSRAHRRGGGARLHAADDLLSDRRDQSRRARARLRGRRLDRRQALSGRSDDQQRQRRHRHPQHLSGARADAADRHGAVRPWRGDRSATSTCSTARPCSSTASCRRSSSDFPDAEDRARAHHDRRSGRISSRASGRTSARRSRRSI